MAQQSTLETTFLTLLCLVLELSKSLFPFFIFISIFFCFAFFISGLISSVFYLFYCNNSGLFFVVFALFGLPYAGNDCDGMLVIAIFGYAGCYSNLFFSYCYFFFFYSYIALRGSYFVLFCNYCAFLFLYLTFIGSFYSDFFT